MIIVQATTLGAAAEADLDAIRIATQGTESNTLNNDPLLTTIRNRQEYTTGGYTPSPAIGVANANLILPGSVLSVLYTAPVNRIVVNASLMMRVRYSGSIGQSGTVRLRHRTGSGTITTMWSVNLEHNNAGVVDWESWIIPLPYLPSTDRYEVLLSNVDLSQVIGDYGFYGIEIDQF